MAVNVSISITMETVYEKKHFKPGLKDWRNDWRDSHLHRVNGVLVRSAGVMCTQMKHLRRSHNKKKQNYTVEGDRINLVVLVCSILLTHTCCARLSWCANDDRRRALRRRRNQQTMPSYLERVRSVRRRQLSALLTSTCRWRHWKGGGERWWGSDWFWETNKRIEERDCGRSASTRHVTAHDVASPHAV